MKDESKKISLLDKWKNKSKNSTITNQIDNAPQGIDIPLSPGQKRLWFLQQMYPDNPFYNYSETYTFNGALNIDFLITSLKRVYQDHDVLRTVYRVNDDTVTQEVDKDTTIDIEIHDLSAFEKQDVLKKSADIQKDDAKKHFDLTKSPLVRASIIKLSDVKHILQITLHHIVTDKWSMRIFREHLSGYYLELKSNKDLTDRRTSIQYTDYSYWLNQKETNKQAINYWKEKLSGTIPKLNLPFDFKRPLQPSFKGGASFTQEYSTELSSNLLELSKQLQTTPYNLMLAVFYVFLYRCSGQNDILVGTPLTNRDQKSLENLIGFFNDTIVLRTHMDPKMSFLNFVTHVRDNTLEAFGNKDVSFDTLVKEINVKRSLSVNPFFQVMFLYHSKPENPFFGDDLSLSHTWFDSEVSKFDLTIYIGEDNGILSSTFEYTSDLFEESTINRFQDYFRLLLEGISSNPDQSLSEIPMLTKSEKDLFLKQKTQQGDFNKGIHNIFESIVEKHPNNKAVSFKDSTLNYTELNNKANAVANFILKSGVKNNAVIGLCVERSMDMIIGILGILKAGCCYLPIDPEYPEDRIDFILDDAKAKLVITQTKLSSFFNENSISCLYLEDISTTGNISNTDFPKVKDEDLAYIIYTSGSTGKPKGVPISHKNIINSTTGRLDFYEQSPEVFLLMSSISFDSSKAGIFWTLCTGGNLVISEKRLEQDIDKIGNTINDYGVTHTLMLPSLYKLLLDYIDKDKLKTLATVIVAGEACSTLLCKIHLNLFPNVNLYNEYGPTEASVWCIAHKITSNDLKSDSIPIGKPVANAKIYILNEHMKFAPLGVIGEIYIGGPGLSKGYINRADLTGKSFVEDPYNDKERLYKTGDLGIYRNDGTIYFLGRSDQQIKIRGYRVELSEIENTIKQYNETIGEAFVIVEEDNINIDFDNNINEENLLSLLENLEENELNNLLNSIELLNMDERNYILNQL